MAIDLRVLREGAGVTDDERRRAWMKELEDDWSQLQFEGANRTLGPPDPEMPLIEAGPPTRRLSPREWAAGVSIWCQAAATWRARALASEAAFERWRWWCWRLAGACILISALWWWSR